MAIELVTFQITGISPLLQHNPGGMRRNDQKMGKKEIPTPEAEAERGVYRSDFGSAKGQLYVPSSAFRAAVLYASKGRKIGRTFATQIVKGAVFCPEPEVPLFDLKGKPITTWTIDTRRAVVQKQGVLRSRPKIDNWTCAVPMEFDDQWIERHQVLELLTIGGRICGIGDFRPEKTGPFGRFEVALADSKKGARKAG